MANSFGGRKPFIRHVLEKLNGRFPANGAFGELIVNLNGRNLTVRVFVNNSGVPIINIILDYEKIKNK